jgi:CheY-like chemotaxis protein
MLRSQTILIAEDDPYLREAYIRRFARTPFVVRTARDGEEAVRLLRAQRPDLLICDVMMPRKDGWWVLEQFPKKRRTFPVVMLTNLEDEETRRRCAASGVEAHLVKKNMSLHTLVETVEQLLRPASR